MKSNSLWTQQFQSVVNNGRNHSLVLDLPAEKGGSNNGPSALELCLMSMSGCANTIFAMIAQKMRLPFEKLEVDVFGEQKDNAPTFTDVKLIISIKTSEEMEKIEKCLQITLNTCPVGILFKQAGVNISYEIKKL